MTHLSAESYLHSNMEPENWYTKLVLSPAPSSVTLVHGRHTGVTKELNLISFRVSRSAILCSEVTGLKPEWRVILLIGKISLYFVEKPTKRRTWGAVRPIRTDAKVRAYLRETEK